MASGSSARFRIPLTSCDAQRTMCALRLRSITLAASARALAPPGAQRLWSARRTASCLAGPTLLPRLPVRAASVVAAVRSSVSRSASTSAGGAAAAGGPSAAGGAASGADGAGRAAPGQDGQEQQQQQPHDDAQYEEAYYADEPFAAKASRCA